MVAPEVQGIDLFKIANRSISGWVPSFKMGSAAAPVKLPFCSQLEERILPGPTFDACRLAEPQREQFHRNLRAVGQVLAGAKPTQDAKDAGIPPPTLSRLVKRTKSLGSIACVPYGNYTRKTAMHPAFQSIKIEEIRKRGNIFRGNHSGGL